MAVTAVQAVVDGTAADALTAAQDARDTVTAQYPTVETGTNSEYHVTQGDDPHAVVECRVPTSVDVAAVVSTFASGLDPAFSWWAVYAHECHHDETDAEGNVRGDLCAPYQLQAQDGPVTPPAFGW